MNALERYKAQKQALADAEAFAALLTAEAVASADFDISISLGNGVTAKMPKAMRPYIDAVAVSKADNILQGALRDMRAKLEESALAAKAEYAKIAADTGLQL